MAVVRGVAFVLDAVRVCARSIGLDGGLDLDGSCIQEVQGDRNLLTGLEAAARVDQHDVTGHGIEVERFACLHFKSINEGTHAHHAVLIRHFMDFDRAKVARGGAEKAVVFVSRVAELQIERGAVSAGHGRLHLRAGDLDPAVRDCSCRQEGEGGDEACACTQ